MKKYTGHKIGIRSWRIDWQDGALYFHSQDTLWLPGEEVIAACINGRIRHEAISPNRGCNCGIHSFETLGDLTKYWHPEDFDVFNYSHWIGEVKQWGEIIPGSNRVMRSQFAYPKSITHAVCDECHRFFEIKEIYTYPNHLRPRYVNIGPRTICTSCLEQGLRESEEEFTLLARIAISAEEFLKPLADEYRFE